MKIIFITMNFLCLSIVAVRLYFFYTHNRPNILRTKFAKAFFLYLFYFLFDVWSTIMFWVAFFSTAYWFVFYKLEKNAKLLLPSTHMLNYAYKFFNIFFYIILALKTIAVIMKILIQSNVDIFVIDWERPKSNTGADGKKTKGPPDTVAWRSLFIGNELNELQS